MGERTVDLLDEFYAGTLGCSARELRAGRLIVLESDLSSIRFAKGHPLAVYALVTPHGAAIAARAGLGEVLERAVAGSRALDRTTCDRIERAISPLISTQFWFQGVRFFCESGSFRDRTANDAREVTPDEDEHAGVLCRAWGGKVFGRIVDGRVASWAAVKPLSDVVWDVSIETLPDYRGRGYAKSAVSAALKYIFANERVAGWGCDRTGAVSLQIARSVGYQKYALDYGCVEGSEGRP